MTGGSGNFMEIMTSITEEWETCNRMLAKPALEVAQDRLREYDQNHGNEDQVSMTSEDQIKSEYLNHAIACRDMRVLSDIELRDLLSDPLELMGEFREKEDYDSAMKHIEKEVANDARSKLRRKWKETYYWPMIQQRAKMEGPPPEGPLPNARGPKAQITPQEKSAAEQIIAAKGWGASRSNIFKWTSYLKLLSDLRVKGATPFCLCRTPKSKRYFFPHSKEFDTLLSWNKIYDLPLRQLRLRVIAEEADDFSGKSDIEERSILDRLHAPQNMCWGDHLSVWDQESTERENFLASHCVKPTSTKSNIDILRHGIKGQQYRNKHIFIDLFPYDGEQDKRSISSTTASSDLLAASPIAALSPGDFLGIFPGRLRYTDQKPVRSITGPVSNLWLDYSEVMGKLSKIRVAGTGEASNVCLAWEGVNEAKGDETRCQYLRVLVIATRHIRPFDQLIRPP
jgi:hypothetical protein